MAYLLVNDFLIEKKEKKMLLVALAKHASISCSESDLEYELSFHKVILLHHQL